MKKLLLFFSIALCTTVNAQQINSGVATYQTKTTLDMSTWGGRGGQQMSEQQKKQIAERMRSRLEKTYTLTFDKTASTYEEVEKLETPSAGGGGGRWGGGFSQGAIYKNIAENLYLRENDLMGKIFLVKDSLPKLDWKLEKESKMIGQYAAFKATATRKDDDLFQMVNRRRRDAERADTAAAKDSAEVTRPEEALETVTVWYTPQIPVAQGPDEYAGLPGLILEVNDGRTVMLCTKIVLNPTAGVDIKQPTKGKEVTKAEYNQIMEEKTKEMAERFRNGAGRGPGRN